MQLEHIVNQSCGAATFYEWVSAYILFIDLSYHFKIYSMISVFNENQTIPALLTLCS